MIDISKYMDYRKYLDDCYLAVKRENPRFSYQAFSRKAGISSKGHLYGVLRGERHLSTSQVVGMGKALNLNKHEFAYFENLVAYNCARKASDKQYYFERLTSIKASGSTAWRPQMVRSEQYEYFSRWYHSALRSLIAIHGFSGDYHAMAKRLYPSITVSQVKKSIELLLSLGFIKKTGQEKYTITDKTVITEPEVVSLAVHNFHIQSGELAVAAFKELPKHRRNFSAVTIGISEKTYHEICKDIETFRSHLLEKVEKDRAAKAVYQINFQFYPVSHQLDERSIE